MLGELARANALLSDPMAWGRELILTQDADPVYTMLSRAEEEGAIGRDYRDRWLIAYWCLYHCGVSSHLAMRQGKEFWDGLYVAADNTLPSPLGERWPRAHERRHWRGEKAVNCVKRLAVLFPQPEALVAWAFKEDSYKGIISRVCDLPQFGPWIAFKVADMGERVLGYPIRFPAEVAMYREPAKGAELARELWGLSSPQEAVTRLLNGLGDTEAPPRRRASRTGPGGFRGCGIQEVETVLCKWKSALNGHYHIGKDIDEVREGMQAWGVAATDLAAFLPPAVPADHPGRG